MENIITVEHVTKRFGQATVLNDINVSFEKGKIHGLILHLYIFSLLLYYLCGC